MPNEKNPTKFTGKDAREPVSCPSVLCLLSHASCPLAPTLACPVSHFLSVSRLLSLGCA